MSKGRLRWLIGVGVVLVVAYLFWVTMCPLRRLMIAPGIVIGILAIGLLRWLRSKTYFREASWFCLASGVGLGGLSGFRLIADGRSGDMNAKFELVLDGGGGVLAVALIAAGMVFGYFEARQREREAKSSDGAAGGPAPAPSGSVGGVAHGPGGVGQYVVSGGVVNNYFGAPQESAPGSTSPKAADGEGKAAVPPAGAEPPAAGGQEAATRPWTPREQAVFVGRSRELDEIDAAFTSDRGARVAVVAVQGMPGVGKTYLVEQWCARNGGRFGKLCRWVIDPLRPAEAKVGWLTLAAQAGIDTDRTPANEIPMRLEMMRALVHVDNVDGEDAAKVVVSLLRELPKNAAIVTGRYTALGTSKGTGWHRVEVACFSPDDAVVLLRQELGADAPSDADLRRLAVSVGGLPLALHLAAGYLGWGYTVEPFLKQLSASGLSLEQVDPSDPLTADRCRGVISASFAVSKELLVAEGARRGKDWGPALARLGWTVPDGFESSLGAAFAGLEKDAFVEFVSAAAALSLVHRVPRSERRPEGAWSVHPLIAEFLRDENERAGVWARVGKWIATPDDRTTRIAGIDGGCLHASNRRPRLGFARWGTTGLSGLRHDAGSSRRAKGRYFRGSIA